MMPSVTLSADAVARGDAADLAAACEVVMPDSDFTAAIIPAAFPKNALRLIMSIRSAPGSFHHEDTKARRMPSAFLLLSCLRDFVVSHHFVSSGVLGQC